MTKGFGRIIGCLTAALMTALFLLTPLTAKAYVAEDALNLRTTSEEGRAQVLARYERIPQQIRTAFETLGWRIEVTDQATLLAYRGPAAKQYPWYYEVAGTTIVDLRLICLSDKGNYAAESINHEMGHFFDNCLTTLDGSERAGKTAAFHIIFNEEKAFLGSEYTSSSSTEFFAEAFKYYVEYPDFLAGVCPKTFAYIDNEVRKFQYLVGDSKNFNLPALSTARVTSDGKYLFNGLDFSPVFNAAAYYNRYPDLQEAIGYDKEALFRHFLRYGIAEGRVGI